MTRARLGRYSLLATLYFAQGLPFGFFVQALPTLLRQAGYSLTSIGLVALLALPWALKFTWAPVVDRYYATRLGRRRTWILAMQAAATLVLGGLALAPGATSLDVFMAAMFVSNLIAATQDIATDGLAVELLPPADRGIANGLQVAGYRVGMLVGGGALLALFDDLGARGVFAVMAVLTVLASIQVVLLREPATLVATASTERPRHFLALPGAWRILALVMLYKLGEAAGQNMLKPFLVDHGLGTDDIAWIGGTVGVTAGMLGAIVGGAAVGRLGRRRALIWFGLGQVVSVGGYAYLAALAPSYTALTVWAGVEHFASGMATASLFTAMMDWSRPIASGTDYTVQASAVVIATTVPAPLGGALADRVGYAPYFAVAAGLCALAVIAVARLFPTRPFPPP